MGNDGSADDNANVTSLYDYFAGTPLKEWIEDYVTLFKKKTGENPVSITFPVAWAAQERPANVGPEWVKTSLGDIRLLLSEMESGKPNYIRINGRAIVASQELNSGQKSIELVDED
jgi:hypothetical protein